MKKNIKCKNNTKSFFGVLLYIGSWSRLQLGILRSLFKDSMFTEFNHFSSCLTVIASRRIVFRHFLNTIFITLQYPVPLNIAIVALAAYGFSKFQLEEAISIICCFPVR
ncbi:MAG: hypothetical protein ACLR2E_19220 [Lachnospiraceae bacterium]